jgi:hypothetical protein
MKRISIFNCIFTVLALHIAMSGHAAEIYVDPSNTSGPWDGTSWATADTAIILAINRIRNVEGEDTIYLKENCAFDTIHIFGAANPDNCDVGAKASITIEGNGATLYGLTGAKRQLFKNGKWLRMKNLTVKDCNSAVDLILFTGNYLEMDNCRFENNATDVQSGSLINVNNATGNNDLVLKNCVFSGNLMLNSGLLRFNSGIVAGGSLRMENCAFYGNSTGITGTINGAVVNNIAKAPVDMTVSNCTFFGNGHLNGGATGAVFNLKNTALAGGKATFVNNTFYANPIGAVYEQSALYGSIVLLNNVIVGKLAGGNERGVHVNTARTVTAANNVIVSSAPVGTGVTLAGDNNLLRTTQAAIDSLHLADTLQTILGTVCLPIVCDSSLLIDSGLASLGDTVASPAADVLGTVRANGTATGLLPDIGAFEYVKPEKPGNPTAIHRTTTAGIGIAPNPAHDCITVSHAEGLAVSIYSLAGVKVFEAARLNGPAIPVARLSPGVYTVRVGNESLKFIKK